MRNIAGVLTNPSSDSQGSLPPPTPFHALVHRHPVTRPFGIAVDERLGSVVNWTTVTDDVDLLVGLLSTWSEGEFRYLHFLDLNAFLEDMASGRNVFCSELLVNAMLACACVKSFGYLAYNIVANLLLVSLCCCCTRA